MIPINVDINATRLDYLSHAAVGKVLIFSSFYTFQGEGPFAGTPALFVRLAGCNIGLKQDCPWCDTKFDLAAGVPWSMLDFLSKLSATPQGTNLVVVTGGEPLLQWDTMVDIIDKVGAARDDLTWQFETNGLLLRSDMLEDIKWLPIHIVVSPKVPHLRYTYRPLPAFFCQNNPALNEKISLKYVVEDDDESPYWNVPSEAYVAAEAGFNVYVSGMTVYRRAPVAGEVANVWDDTLVHREATARNYKHAARLALASGFKVSYQTHLFGAVE